MKYTISSVINQTYLHSEIIAIGDYCTERGGSLLLQTPESHFITWKRTLANSHIKGGLIAWLNHNDLWYPEHLQMLVNGIRKTDSGPIYSWFLPYNSHKFKRSYNLPVYTNDHTYFPFFSVPASGWLVKKGSSAGGGLRKIYDVPA